MKVVHFYILSAVGCPLMLTCLFEKASSLHVRSHSSEYDAKIVLVVIQYGLARQFDKRALPTDLLRGSS